MYEFLSIISNVLVVMGYLPEFYSLLYDVEIKVTTSIWVIWIASGGFAVAYAVTVGDTFVIINTSICLGMNTLMLIAKKIKSYIYNLLIMLLILNLDNWFSTIFFIKRYYIGDFKIYILQNHFLQQFFILIVENMIYTSNKGFQYCLLHLFTFQTPTDLFIINIKVIYYL